MLRSASRETKIIESGTKRVPADRESELHPFQSTNVYSAGGPVNAPHFSALLPFAAMHHAFGNQAVLRTLSLRRPTIQAKPKIGTPGDPYEQEADRVAEQVMRMPDPTVTVPSSAVPVLQRKCTCGGSGKGDGTCSECAKRQELQRSAAGPAAVPEAPPIVHEILGQPGRPLDPKTRAFFEPRFGVDFSTVRVHTDSPAAASARAVNARAYTVGPNIVFQEGQYTPGSIGGKTLLAHELAHTIQQSSDNVGPQHQHIRRAAPPTVLQRDLATPPPNVAPDAQPDLTPTQIQEAINYNRRSFDAVNTRLIQNILGGPVTGSWTVGNIEAIAATQEEFGLNKDGKVGPATFGFITGEQSLEGSDTKTANCLTSFRVNTFPTLSSVTPGPGGTTSILGHHEVDAEFSDRCNCGEFQYRQFIAGAASVTHAGVPTDLRNKFSHIPGGELPLTTMREDGNTTWGLLPNCGPYYGHRDKCGFASTTTIPENRYITGTGATDQSHGCRYKTEDYPKLKEAGLATGDTVDLKMDFRGEIQRNKTTIQTLNWTTIDETITTP